MHATLASRAISGACVFAVALLLASCKLNPTYSVGGTVSGLAGTGLMLQNNGGDNLAISANGAFTFSTKLKKNANYGVTVLTQPSGQSCTLGNGTGRVSRNVTDVAVACVTVTSAFTIGGTVSGLTGAGLVLQNNGSNDLAISADGVFTFSTALASGVIYSVTVLNQPSGQGCSVANGSGTIAGVNVTNVAVACAAPPAAPTLSLGFGVKELKFTWPAVSGADFYQLLENPDGVSSEVQVATNITALSYDHTIPVHRRMNASYVLEACNAGGCTRSFALNLGTNLTQAIGYVKASNTEAGDQLGIAVALSSDGNTLAVGAHAESSGLTGVTTGSVSEATAGNAAPGSGAVYVFARIAGTWLQQAYVKASNTGAGDAFGAAVALSGDGNTLAVGARSEDSPAMGIGGNQTDDCGVAVPVNCASESGAVYVYTRSAGTWSQQAYVKASNTMTWAWFGNSVALSGDGNALAVGAVFESSSTTGINSTPDQSAPFAGAVYVFARSTGTWSQQAYVKSSNTEAMDTFGNSVAMSSDGNTLAVGTPREDSALTGVAAGMVNEATSGNAATESGAVYVYTRSAGTWSQQAYVKASNTEADDAFGMAVALSGDGSTLAVGAFKESSALFGVTAGAVNEATAGNAAFQAGAVYIYTRIAGTWSQDAYVKASNTGAGDAFGIAVALSGDGNALAVGAQSEDGGTIGVGSTPDASSITDAGAVYFYARSAGAWSQQTYVKASNTRPSDLFGSTVALSGDGSTLAVGAQFEDGGTTGIGSVPTDTAADAGAVYLY